LAAAISRCCSGFCSRSVTGEDDSPAQMAVRIGTGGAKTELRSHRRPSAASRSPRPRSVTPMIGRSAAAYRALSLGSVRFCPGARRVLEDTGVALFTSRRMLGATRRSAGGAHGLPTLRRDWPTRTCPRSGNRWRTRITLRRRHAPACTQRARQASHRVTSALGHFALRSPCGQHNVRCSRRAIFGSSLRSHFICSFASELGR